MSIFDYLNNIKDPLGLVANRPLYRENGSTALPGLPYVQLPTQQDTQDNGLDAAALQQQLAYQAEQQRLQEVARQQAEDYAAQQQAQAQAAAQAAEEERRQQAQQAVMNQFTEMMNPQKKTSAVEKPLVNQNAQTDQSSMSQGTKDLSGYVASDSKLDRKQLSPHDLGVVQLMDSGMTQEGAENYLNNYVAGVKNIADTVGGPLNLTTDEIEKSLSAYNNHQKATGEVTKQFGTLPSDLTSQGVLGAINEGTRNTNGIADTIQSVAHAAVQPTTQMMTNIDNAFGNPTWTGGADRLINKGDPSELARALGASAFQIIPGSLSIFGSIPERVASDITGYSIDDNGNKYTQNATQNLAADASSLLDVAGLVGGVGGSIVRTAGENVAKNVLKQAGKEALISGLSEGLTEAAQTPLDAVANNQQYTSDDVINSALTAGVGGAMFGGAMPLTKAGIEKVKGRKAETSAGGVDVPKVEDEVDASFLNDKFTPSAYADELNTTPVEPVANEMPSAPLPDTPLQNVAETPISNAEKVVEPQQEPQGGQSPSIQAEKAPEVAETENGTAQATTAAQNVNEESSEEATMPAETTAKEEKVASAENKVQTEEVATEETKPLKTEEADTTPTPKAEKAVETKTEEAQSETEKSAKAEKPTKAETAGEEVVTKPESVEEDKVVKPESVSEETSQKAEKTSLVSEKEDASKNDMFETSQKQETAKNDLIETKDTSRENMVRAAAEVAQESGGHPSESMSASMFRKKVEEKTGEKLSGSLLNDAKQMYSDKDFNPGDYASRENPVMVENGSVKTDMKTAPIVSAFKLKSGEAEGQLAKWDGSRFTKNGKKTKVETSEPLNKMLKKYKGTTDIYVSDTAKDSVVAEVEGKPAIVLSKDAAKTDPFKTKEDRSRTFVKSLEVSDSKRASALNDQLKAVASDSSLSSYRSEAKLDVTGERAVDAEVASYVLRDYAEGKQLSPRVEAWAAKFSMYTKDSLGMQQFTIKEVMDMSSDQLLEEMGKNHINDISRMTDPTYSVNFQKIIDGNPDEVRAAIPEEVRNDVSEHIRITSMKVPNGAVIGEEINAKDIPNSLVDEKISLDENGRPIPPNGEINIDDFVKQASKDGSPWNVYMKKTLDFVDEQKKTNDFVNQCDATYNRQPFEPNVYKEQPTVGYFYRHIREFDAKYNQIVGMIRGLHVSFYQKFADPYAPVTSIQNFANDKDFKAKKKAWRAKEPDAAKAHRADRLREVSNADVLKCNARDRIQTVLRRAGWNKIVDWAAGSAEKQQAIGDYMQGKQVIGAFDVLYDEDIEAFSNLAKEWGVEPDAVRLHAQNLVDRADIPEDMREKIDNCVKECSDYVVNTSLETGRITPDVAEKILALNEQGSYWIMKFDNSKVKSIEESLLNADPNVVSDIGGDMIHFKEEQFRLADSHPLTAVYKETEIITHTCDNLRMNNAIVDYLTKVGLAKEFDINLYEKGSEALPSFEKSGMKSKEAYEDMKKLVDELTEEKKDLRYLETMKDGERKAVAVPADVFEALQDMGVKRLQSGSVVLDGAANFARMAATVVRAGTTTYYMPRQVWLLTKDLFQIGTQAPVADVKGLITPIWIAKGAKDAFFNRDEMIRKGVLGDYAARVATKDARKEMEKEFRAGDIDISKADVAERHTTAVLEYVINTMEAIGRSTLYEMEYHTAKKWGRSDSEAEMFARTWAAEGLGNFRESGAWMHRVVQFAPYLNSAIQGTRGSLKMASAQPALTAIRTAMALGTLYMAQTAAVSALGYAKDKWDEVCNALPDSTKYKGIPFPIPGEEPKINTDTKKLEGVWILQMPDDLYSVLNVINDMNHSSRTFGESVYNNATMALMAFTGVDAVGNNWTDSFYSLMNQWTPVIIKPTAEQLMNRNFYSNTSLLNPDAVDLANQHIITRNSIESYSTSDIDKRVADFITAVTGGLIDTNAADVHLYTQSAGTMLANVADGKNPFDLPVSIIDPYYKTSAASPFIQDDVKKLLYEKWGGYSAGQENEQTFDSDYKKATKLINGVLYDGKSPDELRSMVETGDGTSNPNTAAILMVGIGLEAHDEGWNKDDTAKEVAKYYNKSQSELYAMSEDDVKKYFSYVGYAAEKLNSPMLKAEVVLANSERFWNISQDADSRAKMETSLRSDYNDVDKILSTIDTEISEGGMDSTTAIRVATKDADEDVRILFANYENNFDPDTWYKPSDIKDMLKADTAVVSDDDYNAKALKYYETLYSADTVCSRDDRDNYSIKDKSSGYLKTVAELNSMYGIAKWVQQAYGDAGTGDTSGNITLTEWKALVTDDPDKAAYLLSYDNARVEAGVSRGSTVNKNKYYLSSSSSSYSKRGYSSSGYGSSSGNWIPSVSDLTNTVYTPKGSTTSTTVSEKKPKVAPITKKAGETFAAGSGTKIKPTTFKAADTVQYTPSKTRQPAMGPAYDAFLNGKSAQSDFKAARQYI